ncbi:MAG: YeaH/YhbH family protein [Planctomycetota bacterium]|nr:YeaH/YhbH family protein [Planctomycetota bacterium]
MTFLIDRRLNPKDKSLVNRQRFMRRARAQIKEAVNKSLKDRNIADDVSGETVSIPSKGIHEPRFRLAPTGGHRERIFPGNKEFTPGDRIPKPPTGNGGGGKRASDHGEGEDEFSFVLSREEFLDLFFEDLELPDLIKTNLRETTAFKPRRAGFAVSGTTTNINIVRTMRNSRGRRLALRRPVLGKVEELRRELDELTAKDEKTAIELRRLLELQARLEEAERRWRAIPYIDPLDIRYNRYEQCPEPKTSAVMFCLMDVSGSMGPREKDLAKRFFMLLHIFLKRRYERIDLVFIRHTHEAQEVDEETFFHSRETGGTVVSTALVEMKKILRKRYPVQDWNIYAAQASDGDNFENDTGRCVELLASDLLPLCQYVAYIEILDERELELFQNSDSGKALWRGYSKLAGENPNFAMKRIAKPGDIYPIFRELFAKQAETT